MKTNKNLKSFDIHLDENYGKPGTKTREKFDEEFETFKIGVLIQEARKKQHLTQQQLAEKVGTTKNYISRIENDKSDIEVGTLRKIIEIGLNKRLNIQVR